MDDRYKKNQAVTATPSAERRRIATVVRDERGNAIVAWRDAPADHARPKLELEEHAVLKLREERGFDPYARHLPRVATTATAPRGPGPAGRRTDLRRLSEWIKMMRDLEQRRRQDGSG